MNYAKPEGLKVTRGVEPGPDFFRDVNVIKSFSKENYSKLVDYLLELYLSEGPIDAETFKKWVKDFGETEARVNAVSNMTFFLLTRAVRYELTKEEFERDLDNLGLGSHKDYLINLFIKFKEKIKAKIDQKRYYFNSQLRGCEWRIDNPLKVSIGKPYDELIAIINFQYEDLEGESKEISFETDTKMLKVIVMNLEKCLKEAEEWEKKK